MEIDIFTICDFAQDMNGKLIIVGTFDTILTSKLPAVRPTVSVVVRFRFKRNEIGKHSFKIAFLDDKGREFLPPTSGDIDIQIKPSMEEGTANVVMGIGMLKIPSYGKYFVTLLFDNKLTKSLPITVVETQQKSDGH